MSERPIDINLSKTNIPNWDPDSPDFNEENFAKYVASVLDRGFLADRTHVDLPNDMYGEWVPTGGIDVERMKALGFKVDTEYAAKRGIHDAADGTVRCGDTVFMVAPMKVKKVIDAINRNKYRDANDPKKTKEEILFRARLREQKQNEGVEFPEVDTSSLDSVYGRDIHDQVKAGSLEISPSAERLDKPAPGPNQIVFKG